MGNKGGSKHLNRIAAPEFAAPERKTAIWLAKPSPGRHALVYAASLRAIVRDSLGLASDARETEKIVQAGEILVDGKVVKDSKAAIGLMDIIAIPKINKYYLVLLDKKSRMLLKAIDKAKAGVKLCKIVGKHTVAGGKVQLSLHDGKTLLADKSYSVGDSIKLKVPECTIAGTLRLEPGARCFIMRGKHAGGAGKLGEITTGTEALEARATLDVDGQNIITLKDYLFVVGDEI
ncbi:MAG: 30S ribosomal protein S4e [Candidatus Burarchaeum sp.]|nr:30S ribosomal protein S4e [Candidatus Burarchaeum sp.]MDO8339371.1 30S ribosomal protein S4e [Candidatus Burarchaeum sp.]